MGRFWIEDSFIRDNKFKLDPTAAMAYIILCCHANREGYTFIGTRHLGELLNVSKSAAARAIKRLEAVPLVGHRKVGLSHLQVLTVPLEGQSVPLVGQKEVLKEVCKEGANSIKRMMQESSKGQGSLAKEVVRAKLGF